MTDYHITADLTSIEALHQGKLVTIQREQNPPATIRAEYAATARPCPPYCIQPMQLAAGVATLGELEVLDMLRRIRHGESGLLVVDSRTPDWYAKVTIPGVKKTLVEIYGAKEINAELDFSNAHTLAIFCNGPWCGQTPNYLRTLLALGYPAEKLKWYRGGMQDWCALGLTVI